MPWPGHLAVPVPCVTVRAFAAIRRLDSAILPGVTCCAMLGRFLSIILCVALFLPQAGQAHVHLCLDGGGPAVSVHTPESGEQCPHVDQAGHHDHTVEVDSPALGKAWPSGPGAALFLVVVVLFALARRVNLLPVPAGGLPPAAPLFLRPPLRGPPA